MPDVLAILKEENSMLCYRWIAISILVFAGLGLISRASQAQTFGVEAHNTLMPASGGMAGAQHRSAARLDFGDQREPGLHYPVQWNPIYLRRRLGRAHVQSQSNGPYSHRWSTADRSLFGKVHSAGFTNGKHRSYPGAERLWLTGSGGNGIRNYLRGNRRF